MTLLKSLRELLRDDLLELPLQCAVTLTYFIQERARRVRRRIAVAAPVDATNRPR